jgi:hypothetical protein
MRHTTPPTTAGRRRALMSALSPFWSVTAPVSLPIGG